MTRRAAVGGRPPLLLDARGVSRSFGDRLALDCVDLRVCERRIVGLVGPNGSGKTTMLEIVVGLRRADQGLVLVSGAPVGSAQARAATAFVPDEPTGLDELTVDEASLLLRRLYGADEASQVRNEALLEAFGLLGRRHARLASLSHGLRRQASIVRALSLATPLVVVDEATATLDPEAVVVLREALRAHAVRGGGALVATQDLRFAEQICDVVVLLAAGRVVDVGSSDRLRARHDAGSLEGAFLAAIGEPDLGERVHARLAGL